VFWVGLRSGRELVLKLGVVSTLGGGLGAEIAIGEMGWIGQEPASSLDSHPGYK
jgi:hypothetical protein